MKIFKGVLCLALTTLILLCPAAVKVATAQTPSVYAYADIGSSVYFCNEPDGDSALFYIPQTYCVEILKEEGEWYYCKYAEDNGAYRAVYGYCRKDGLKICAPPPQNIYLDYKIKVLYKAEQGSPLFPPLEIELTAAFYGSFTVGDKTLSYVYCGESFGYISETVANYPLNELPKPVFSQTEPQSANSNTMLITAVVITLIAVIAVAALYFSGKKPKLPPPKP